MLRPNKFYDKIAIKRPIIRKHGTIKCDTVEATPIVFNGRLYRLEYFHAGFQNEANDTNMTHMHFIDVETNRQTTPFAFDHCYGTAFTEDSVMYVAASRRLDAKVYPDGVVDIYRSTDLENWELISSLTFPGVRTFNNGICKKDGKYIILTEVDKPVMFTFVFAESTDMVNWTHLPADRHFQDKRYAGGPAIYTLTGDPYYYVFYVEAQPGFEQFTNCLARSKDLIKWEYSPINPVLMYNEYEDKKIANPFLNERERTRIDRALDINNSDLEMCDWKGRTVIYYSWGNQHGNEYLAEASYEGSMAELLHGFFDKSSEE